MYLLQSKFVLSIENFVICSYIATRFLMITFPICFRISFFKTLMKSQYVCLENDLKYRGFGLAEVCVSRDIAGDDIVSTTAREASSVELDAPSDNSSMKG